MDEDPHRTRRLVFAVLAGGVLSIVAWTGIALVGARSDLQDAAEALEALRAEGSGPTTLPQTLAALEQAREDLASADRKLNGFGPRLAGTLPVLGRWVDAPSDLAGAGRAVVGSTQRVLATVGDGRDLLVGGQLQLPRLQQLQVALADAAERTRGPVEQLQRTRTRWLPGPIADGVRDGQRLLGPAPQALTRATDALAGLQGVFGGDGARNVLVALANNAEQRGGGGLISVYSQGTARDGRLELTDFGDVFDVADPPARARRVPAPPDYRSVFGPFLADTTIWRNANMSPDGPSSLGVLAQVARATTRQATDVVISLDAPGIAAVLGATGPAQLPDGRTLRAEDAVSTLLLDSYSRFPDTPVGQGLRRKALSDSADAVLDRVLSGGGDAVGLARALTQAAAGRHLQIWSARPQEQALLESAGLAGAVRAADGDLVQVFTHNLGQSVRDPARPPREGNKLDYFAQRSHDVTVRVGRDEARVTQEFTLTNTAPASGLPGYVLGPDTPGELNALVGFALPADAAGASLQRDDQVVLTTPVTQQDHALVRDVVRLPPGGRARWRLDYVVPVVDGRYRLRLVPQALSADAQLRVRLQPDDGVELSARPDQGLVEASARGLILETPFSGTRTLTVEVEQQSQLRRAGAAVRRFWSEPVGLPG